MGTEVTVRIGSGLRMGSGLDVEIAMAAVMRCWRQSHRSREVHTKLRHPGEHQHPPVTSRWCNERKMSLPGDFKDSQETPDFFPLGVLHELAPWPDWGLSSLASGESLSTKSHFMILSFPSLSRDSREKGASSRPCPGLPYILS